MRIDEDDRKLYEQLYTGEKKRSELLSALDWPRSNLDRKLEKAIKYNLVSSPKRGIYVLTDEGRKIVAASFISTAQPDLEDIQIKALINIFPTEEYRAFFRLAFSHVAGKQVLLPHFDRGWLCFISFGRSQTLKTTIVELLCYLFGLKPGSNLYHAPYLSPRELMVRHVSTKGGYKGITSASLQEPLLVIDECDKVTSEAVKRGVFSLLTDRRSFPVEGTEVDVKCTIFLTMNAENGVSGLTAFGLEPSYLRRAIIFHTTPLAPKIGDTSAVAAKLLKVVRGNKALQIDLTGLKPRLTSLPPECQGLVKKLISLGIKEEFKSLADAYSLEILSLCRLCVLKNGTSPEDAIYDTINDYLCCLDTVGAAQVNWKDILASFRQNPTQLPAVASTPVLVPAADPATTVKQAGNVQSPTKPVSAEKIKIDFRRGRLTGDIENLKEKLLNLPQNALIKSSANNLTRLLQSLEKITEESSFRELEIHFQQEVKPEIEAIIKERDLATAKEKKMQEIAAEKEKITRLRDVSPKLEQETLVVELVKLRCGKWEGWFFTSLDGQLHSLWPFPDMDNMQTVSKIVSVKLALLEDIEKIIREEKDQQVVSLSLPELEKLALKQRRL